MLKQLTFLILLLIPLSTFANEKKLEKESTVFNETFSWQAQMGLSLQYGSHIIKEIEQQDFGDYISLLLLVDFYYKGFFIQSNHRRADTFLLGAELGYQLRVRDDWELDIISKSYISGFDSDYIIDDYNIEIPILMGLKERDVGDGIGIRYSRYYENSILSVDIASLAPFSDADGWVADIFYSHLIPYRNWDIYLNGGLTYYSDSVIDYYVGINEDEVTNIRPQFKGTAGFKTQLEVFAQHPISKSWTFNIGLSQSLYSSNIADSPIVKGRGATQVMLGVLYVF